MDDGSPSILGVDISCCADLYQFPMVRSLLGGSLHPGGLALTRAQAKEIGLSKDDHLLDVACGSGSSAIMLAQVYKCRVTGIDAEPRLLEEARRDAHRYRLEHLASFCEGDAVSLPFLSSSFDAVLCECSTTLFPEKASALREIGRVLRPGGRLALSDVTYSLNTLPAALDAPLARTLCIPLAVSPDVYVSLIESAGLTLQSRNDYSAAIEGLLDKIEALLGVGRQTGPADREGGEQSGGAVKALQAARRLVNRSELGYWAFTARKPGDSAA